MGAAAVIHTDASYFPSRTHKPAFGGFISDKPGLGPWRGKLTGIKDSNEAEMRVILSALRAAKNSGVEDVEVRTDSKSAVVFLTKQADVNPKYGKLVKEIRKEARSFKTVIYNWVPRKENNDADRLCRLQAKR